MPKVFSVCLVFFLPSGAEPLPKFVLHLSVSVSAEREREREREKEREKERERASSERESSEIPVA